jgi:hypothetical protein
MACPLAATSAAKASKPMFQCSLRPSKSKRHWDFVTKTVKTLLAKRVCVLDQKKRGLFGDAKTAETPWRKRRT